MSKVSKGKKVYKTMRGKTIDMDLLQKKNELVPAVGNARVNARGDELGPNGKIIRKREDIIKEYYEQNTGTMPNENGRFVPPSKTQSAQVADDLTSDEKELLEEDEWIENEDGDFVKKTTKTTSKRTTKKD